ncbi:NADH:flavin oxidoreductase [Haladaptatus pallidirubidus]|uniref:NADH:flavin oxidoreductase n=1 Tax=Haladaptatus pallidirubidus TaxID=1008152 RepID=A0AAV3UNV2_9EURY|nr:NADH:flavin oxidoreductase [Haladaptatus pallidirubidus]
MAELEDPLEIAGVELPNRLYRAPLLECAGNGPDAVDALIRELTPAAESEVGLICQGATIVRGEGGCAAPGMTRVHDPAFVSKLTRLTDAIHDRGSRIFVQLEHGGLRSMETWHAGYRAENSDLRQLAVSRPPPVLRALDRVGFLSYDAHVLGTAEVYDLAEDFGRSASYAIDAGYDGIHIAGANMGIVQQFLSPFYNRRTDEFGGSLAERTRFLELVHDEIRRRVGPDVPIMTKVPAETTAPRFVRKHLSLSDGVRICDRLTAIGFDALVPVQASVFWDASIVRGAFPACAWRDERFREGYADAFGSKTRAGMVAFLNWFQSKKYDFDSAWNRPFTSRVASRVSVPVLAEGGIRNRDEIDRLLGGGDCDAVGMGRPFYAEPRLPARILGERSEESKRSAICENCNNCTVPQATGARGVCRTPSVLEKRGELRKTGAYGGEQSDG